jgi:antitoxin component YwqK of YwqJK toxin-antitoxin module
MKKILVAIILITGLQLNAQIKDSVLNYIDINKQKQGHWQRKYKNGKIAYDCYFINDKPIGVYKRYYATGKLKMEANYNKNQEASAKLYWDNGKLMAEGKYVEINVRDSLWKMYGVDGKLMVTIEYKHGKKHGKEISYFRNGQINEVKTWKNDTMHGPWLWYYDNGKPRMKANYVNGVRDGYYMYYHQDGSTYISGYYKNNLRDGKWKFNYLDKSLNKTIIYHNGKAENQDELDREETKIIESWEKMRGQIPEPTFEDFMYGPRRR